jgi:tetrahydromethanopterin S-methyltransferase subunit G
MTPTTALLAGIVIGLIISAIALPIIKHLMERKAQKKMDEIHWKAELTNAVMNKEINEFVEKHKNDKPIKITLYPKQ